MWAPNDKRWLLLFVPVLGAVVLTLAYLHLSNAEEVPRHAFEDDDGGVVEAHWALPKPLYVCDAPDWVQKNTKRAVAFVGELKVTYSDVVVLDGSCAGLADAVRCGYETKSGHRSTACLPNGIVLTLADEKYNFGDADSGGHGDETLMAVSLEDGSIQNVTALFPAELSNIKEVDVEDASDAWPADVEFLTVVHALLHAEGFDHVQAPLLAEPTGHIMASSISKLGTDTAGL